METIKITAEDGEVIELTVLEETKMNGINYLLVTEEDDEEGDEAPAYILKDISRPEDEEAIYEFVEDDDELNALADVFSELVDDTDIINP